jgi:hypothetical protein
MKREIGLALAWLLVAAAARGDTIFFVDQSRINGTIGKIALNVGGETQEVARDDIQSGVRKDKEWQILTKAGRLHVGKLASVSLVHPTGEKTFAGKTVLAFRLRKSAPKAPEGKPDEPKLPDDGRPEKKELTAEEKAELREMAKTAARLRDESIQKAKDIAGGQHNKLRDKYQAKVDTARSKLAEAKKELGKHIKDIETGGPEFKGSGLGIGFSRNQTIVKSGAAAVALEDYNRAKARCDALAAKIKALKAAIRRQRQFRVKRIEAYHAAILRHLRKGKPLPEDTMQTIFDKAVGTDDD